MTELSSGSRPAAAAELPASPTGSSLQRLADAARERDAGRKCASCLPSR